MYKTLRGPLSVQIEIESACTNACLHCYNFWRREQKSQTTENRMSVDSVEKIITKLAEEKVFQIVFTGGEPLLNKLVLFYGLELAHKLRVGISLNSNLVLLTEKDAHLLKQLRIYSVLTSVLGPNKEIHDSITLNKGSFDKTIQGIKLLQKYNIYPTVNIVISKKNKDYLKDTMRYLVSLGVKHISSTRVGWPGNCSDFSSFSLSFNEFQDYLKNFTDATQELNIPTAVLESYPYCGMRELSSYQRFLGRRCNAGVTTLTIGVDGSVRPCSHLNVQYGNLLTEDLKTIWLRMESWRNGNMLPLLCKICPLLHDCGGGCRMEAKMQNGSYSALDPYCSLTDIEYTLQQLHKIRRSKKMIETIPFLFTLNDIRIRDEVFGSVVFVGNHTGAYLNHEATDFLRRLKPHHIYSLDDIIVWDEYDKDNLVKFISGLVAKQIIVAVNKGGDNNELSASKATIKI